MTEEQARNLHQFTNKMSQFFKNFSFNINETDDQELTLELEYPELLEHLGIPFPEGPFPEGIEDSADEYFKVLTLFQSYIFWTWGGLDPHWFICSQEGDEPTTIYTKLVWRDEPQETLPGTEHYLADEC